ncbi:hypothetical protein C8J56DRAFT_275255 [Mycena floridula]|nr:hypothetical protein C8J56DRAFT_275255 [Mycena floridula]
MSFSSQIYYIVDDIDNEIQYDESAHSLSIPSLYYGGSSTIFNATCNVQFEGIAISFVGEIAGENISFSIDNDSPFTAATLTNGSYSAFYQSPLLSDGSHSVSLAHDPNTFTMVDYMIIQPGPSTNLIGKTLIVDDTYPGVQYGSNWDSLKYGAGFVALQSSIHQTSTVGSSFNFTYTGSNMTVYGIYEEGPAGGSFDLLTTVDDKPSSTRSFAGKLSSELSWGNHIALFTTEALDPGQHTVAVELSRCDPDQKLAVDYIAYTPSFSSLAEMPAATGRGTAKKPVAAIVGGVVGGLVFLGLLGLFLIWKWKNQKKQRRRSLPAYMDSMALQAFPGNPDRPSTEAGIAPNVNDNASVMDSEKI